MYAFTVSNASAALVKRRGAKSLRLLQKLVAFHFTCKLNCHAALVSGAFVGIARNSLQLNPRNPGNVVHPS